MKNAKIYLVTGAAGFIGRHVCRRLIDSGYNVRALVRRPYTELSQSGVKLWIGDLWDEDVLREALSDVNVVIHCAGNARFGNGTHYHHENVELTKHLTQAVRQHALTDARFVYISTIGAIDRAKIDRCEMPLTEDSAAFPTSDYGKSKLQAEQVVKQSMLPFVIIRPTMVVGDDMRFDSHFAVFARQALSGSLVARLSWPGRFSVIHIDDLASAILKVAAHPSAINHTYFCAGETVSIMDFFRKCNSEKIRISLSLISRAARPLAGWMPFALKAMLFPALTASDEKLRALGWMPRYSAMSALEEVINREKSRLDPDISPGGQSVITGAASGLGRALAIYLSPRRDHLFLIDKNGPALEELAGSLGNCTISVLDLSDEEQVDALLNSSKWHARSVTELYACAGVGFRGCIQNISIDNHRKMFAINVLARIALAKKAISSMQRRYFGRVVLISSSSAFQPLPYMATYAATNSALLSIGESWGAELGNNGIQILTVCPGGMQTNFQKSGGVKVIEGEKLMMPDEVVARIFKGLFRQKKTLIVSLRSFSMSILARCLPRMLLVGLWFRLMEKMR